MMVIVIPRLISISFIISYLKQWTFVIILSMVIFSCLANFRFLKRDPGKTFLGCLTNIFAPAIVIDEGSTFFLKSAIISNIMHCGSLIILALFVTSGALDSTCLLLPHGKTQPAIFHCFRNDDYIQNSNNIMRCPILGEMIIFLISRCHLSSSFILIF